MAARGRRPDWWCGTCSRMTFGSKDECKCGAKNPVPRTSITSTPRESKNDWPCPSCGYVVFGSKSVCFKCKARRPGTTEPVPSAPTSDTARTWRCMECGCTANASVVDVCVQCRGKRGFWHCHTCNFDVFASKASCGKCNGKRPIDGAVTTSPDAQVTVAWKCANCNTGQPEANKYCSACGGSRAGAGEGGEAPCVVCQDAPREALLQHAGDVGHKCVCMDCASALTGINAVCPICRAPITGVIRAFDA